MLDQSSTFVITGATGGIGAELARQLVDLGCGVVLVGRNPDSLQCLQAELGDRSVVLEADLSRSQGQNEVIKYIHQHEQVNGLVQVAGCDGFGAFDRASRTIIDVNLKLNLEVPMRLTLGVIDVFNSRSSSYLTYVGSAFGSIGFAGFSVYSASKFGLRGFVESLQREYADQPICIQNLSPRATATDFNSDEVNVMNKALGNKVDTPDVVAKALIKAMQAKQQRMQIGWPEKLFVRLNGLLPELVDKALAKKLSTIKHYLA